MHLIFVKKLFLEGLVFGVCFIICYSLFYAFMQWQNGKLIDFNFSKEKVINVDLSKSKAFNRIKEILIKLNAKIKEMDEDKGIIKARTSALSLFDLGEIWNISIIQNDENKSRISVESKQVKFTALQMDQRCSINLEKFCELIKEKE